MVEVFYLVNLENWSLEVILQILATLKNILGAFDINNDKALEKGRNAQDVIEHVDVPKNLEWWDSCRSITKNQVDVG